MRLKNIFFFFVVLLLVACKKHDVSKVDQHIELKEWFKQNGEGYKNGVLQFKGVNGETKAGQLNWSQVKTYDIDGIVYTEVPFMFGEENKGELRSNNSDTKVDVAFYLMLRTISGQIEGAIKVVQQNLALKANNETKNGTIESFRNLKNELVNIWFRESTNNNLIALKLAENQIWANAISSLNDVKSNSCDISYTVIRVITGGGVSPDSSPDNVIVYSVYAETTMFKIDCSGSINGGVYWSPTPPPSSAGGGPDQPKKEEIDCATFENKVLDILNNEGGFTNDPNDPGGATNKGISWSVWQSTSQKILNLEPTLQNLQDLTDLQAKEIYRSLYWEPIHADEIIDGDLRYFLFDFYVNAGGNAVKVLQRTINQNGGSVVVDGVIGAKTVEAINSINFIILYNSFKENRQLYYNKLASNNSKLATFLKGWTNRVNKFISKTELNNKNVNC